MCFYKFAQVQTIYMYNYMKAGTIHLVPFSITLCLIVDFLSLNLFWAGKLDKSQLESTFLHPKLAVGLSTQHRWIPLACELGTQNQNSMLAQAGLLLTQPHYQSQQQEFSI